jgi:Transposase zinc-binding domain
VARPAFQVADVFRRHGQAYREANAGHLDRSQYRVMAAIEACRTAALGGHVWRCSACGHKEIAYSSCRDRHCPTCQGSAARAWLEARQADLLPVEYFHVVFTVPQQIAAIAYQNKEVVYSILFEATAETLKKIAGDPEHLGAEIGFTAVLHTWGQTLTKNPHSRYRALSSP